MTPHCTILHLHAIVILQAFAMEVQTANTSGISKVFGDLVGTLPGGRLIIVKLKESAFSALTSSDVEKIFAIDLRLMRCWSRTTAVRTELWIRNTQQSWQFFEIIKDDVREVSHGR